MAWKILLVTGLNPVGSVLKFSGLFHSFLNIFNNYNHHFSLHSSVLIWLIFHRIIHGCTEIWNFSSSVQLDIPLVRYLVEHEKRNSIFPSNHVLFCLLYKYLTYLHEKGNFNNLCFNKRAHCHSFMALNRVIEWRASSWLAISKTHEKWS